MKTTVVILSIILMFLSFLPNEIIESMSLTRDSSIASRITYMFVHGSFLHFTMNAYCLLTIIFLCYPKISDIVVSFIIALCIPAYFIGNGNVVGLSVMLFALTGIIVMRSEEWRKFFMFNLLVVLCGALIPKIAFMPHLWGFSCGCLYGILTAKRYGST